ncbi:MAG: hemerythrin domain-containing protein [Kofleriaceae bacterium]
MALALHSTSGMKTNTIDVLELLTEQHAEVDELFEAIENGNGDKLSLFRELADKLAAHAAIEEKIFYPSVMAKDTEEILHESVEEHLSVKRLLADLMALDPQADADEFDAKISVLKEQVSHHAHEEEEKKLFAKLRKSLSADERAALGNECLAMFETLIESEPRRNVPAETAEAAALPSL